MVSQCVWHECAFTSCLLPQILHFAIYSIRFTSLPYFFICNIIYKNIYIKSLDGLCHDTKNVVFSLTSLTESQFNNLTTKES